MISIICGAALVAGSCAGYWYLLPRNGQEHPLVKNSDVGSMVTITIMATLTIGLGLLLGGFIS
jgi:hypothetical protein